MKRHIRVSDCPICGHKANTSKWWTMSKSGKTYYYFRFYHSVKNIHLVRTNSNYSNPPGIGKENNDLYEGFQDFIYRRMGFRRYSYTTLKKEFERFVGRGVHSQSFCMLIDKAISSGLIKKRSKDKRPIYEKEQEPELKEEIRFEKFTIHYDFSRINRFIRISTFLEVTNTGKLTVERIPIYVPYGVVNSLKELHFSVVGEDGLIPKHNLKLIVSDASETVVSISLTRGLKFKEQEFISAVYEIPRENQTVKLVTKANIGLLRVSVSQTIPNNMEIVRILVDGAKEAISPFQHKCNCPNGKIYLYSEFEDIMKGECISVRSR